MGGVGEYTPSGTFYTLRKRRLDFKFSFTFGDVALDRLDPGHDLSQVSEVGAGTGTGLEEKRVHH